ncbi:YidB family protein [Streptomyces sp. NBC_00237]|uniref:flagellin N-terminal helical domain-containing protein n=1 Tax=Streptomyces sp. NBC_00237 TaxID=2975687 RepID=UPI00224EC856|nr:YidB family protein [Streptomyces sp. NBC_00237]MCX5205817.1 YidB family protein [Streptomyces sp. NBC_00237]
MALILNTNIGSLNAQLASGITNDRLKSAADSLMTGKRINASKDDAAGLAISTRMGVQIGTRTTARRDADGATNPTQVTEGALSSIVDSLARMRELAVQAKTAAPGTERTRLSNEFDRLSQEINQAVAKAQANGLSLLPDRVPTFSLDDPQTVNTALDQAATSLLAGRVAQEAQELAARLPQVTSWLGTGPNEPVTAEQITAAVGKEDLAKIAEDQGKDQDTVARELAVKLPELINAVSPQGTVDGHAVTHLVNTAS